MLPWNERLHGVGTQVIMELVHMHEGLVRFPAVAGIVESRPPDVERTLLCSEPLCLLDWFVPDHSGIHVGC